jgi:glycosyltransferase involved in cell wall biosynthesis
MKTARRPRALVVTLSRNLDKPWWWRSLDAVPFDCEVEHAAILRPAKALSWRFVRMCAHAVGLLFRARREGYGYILTFECDWSSFIFAAIQTTFRWRTPRHVILQFIMREPTGSAGSRLKYAFMRWCFSSVHMFVCSSRSEAEHYAAVFGLPPSRLGFVPFHTDPDILERKPAAEGDFVLAAGRTFRDYATLLQALSQSTIPLVIVASPSSVSWPGPLPANVRVLYDIPRSELIDLIARSMIVALPLEPRQISIGQSVLLEAMAMGKAVVATRVNGTADYVDHMTTGILVPPRDVAALKDAIDRLAGDAELRRQLGRAALERITTRHLPAHYAAGVANVLGARSGA